MSASFAQSIDSTGVQTKTYSKLYLLAVVALFAVIYLGSAYSPALQDDADSTHAEAAREMLVRGDYVTLHVNGIRYLEKAPLMYWAVAVSYRVFGVNEFATRFPTVLAMLLLTLLAMRWGERACGRKAGICRPVRLHGSGLLLVYARPYSRGDTGPFHCGIHVLVPYGAGRPGTLMAVVCRLRLSCAGGANQGVAGARSGRLAFAGLCRAQR
jgi:hypothetical protein